ncbi:hypothetical protein FCM35_KLT11201 [Carex littledalei]|uniref:Uncharacterized protein n=1 Tax=Carex littledalei TaxID=544730 RepID=A0A833QLT9_9POAL|nr:hypothetical protein FCM35_KLT11201 [Carex littledalei]
MSFWVTSVIFALAGVIASLSYLSRFLDLKFGDYFFLGLDWIWENWGIKVPFNIGRYCNCVLLDDVGYCLSCPDESIDQSNPQWRMSVLLQHVRHEAP